MVHRIQSDRMQVLIDETGAQMQSVFVDGQERLWQNPDGSWDGHAPVLFPFCGHCTMLLDEKNYGQGFHGVVQDLPFTCTQKTPSSITFTVTENPQTLKVYPFRFVFGVTYEVTDSTLQIQYQIKNTDDKVIPFACGGHESFALEQEIDAYELVFSQQETLTHYPHDDKGMLTGESVSKGIGKILPLKKEDLSNGDTLILGGLCSDRVTLRERATGKPLMEEAFPGFANILLWRPGNARMICVEPWQNLPDMAKGSDGFFRKSGVRALQPGEMDTYTRTIRYMEKL